MKFKSLFLGMLATAVMFSCNNETIDSEQGGPSGSDNGESTTATFQVKFNNNAASYAGGSDMASSGTESAVEDAALFIYKLDGTPEAMAYLISTDWSSNQKVTVKCKSGDKLIYMALNMGGDKLISHGEATAGSNSGSTNDYMGKDWNVTGQFGPKFSVAYTDADGTNHQALNSAVWSGPTTTIVKATASGFIIPANANADNLIKALTGKGDPTAGVLSGNTGPGYLMTNWGDASSQQPDNGGASGTNYVSTCKFTLEAGVSATDSRAATADVTNANKKNALLINVQRAIAKVSLALDPAVTAANGAGELSSIGTFTADQKWAVGNINCSEYPFQMWDGSIVKSTRYDEVTPILPVVSNNNWANKMDNSRFAGTNVAYQAQTLSTSAIVGNVAGRIIFANAANQAFGQANYALVTENNNSQTYNHYNTFVVFAGQYRPASYVTGVDNVGNVTTSTATPTYGTTDTMHYVGSLDTRGMFFFNTKALREYICYKLGVNTGSVPLNPLTDTEVTNYIASLRTVTGNTQADLQSYWNGYCFYRVWVKDDAASSAANKVLVRRNHAYQIKITEIKGPGIGDPNDIIDPDPTTIEPVEEADTYVTASVTIMNWHVVEQEASTGLD